MPYPNEHAARVRNPGLFEPDSFRSKELKDGVRLILAKLKGGDGSMVIQAYRFSVDKFTVEQVKNWLKDHKVKFIKFEPAQTEEEVIQHVGVKGMQWRIQKKRDMPGESGGKKPKQVSTEPTRLKRNMPGESGGKHSKGGNVKEVANLRKKQINEMSNEELSKVIKRVDLKKKYKDLNSSKTSKGKKVSKNVLSTIGKVATGLAGVAALSEIGRTLYKKITTRPVSS